MNIEQGLYLLRGVLGLITGFLCLSGVETLHHIMFVFMSRTRRPALPGLGVFWITIGHSGSAVCDINVLTYRLRVVPIFGVLQLVFLLGGVRGVPRGVLYTHEETMCGWSYMCVCIRDNNTQ